MSFSFDLVVIYVGGYNAINAFIKKTLFPKFWDVYKKLKYRESTNK